LFGEKPRSGIHTIAMASGQLFKNDPVPYYCVAQVEKVLWNTIFLVYTIYDVQTRSAFISLVGPCPWAPMGVAKCCRVRIGDTNVDVGSNVVE